MGRTVQDLVENVVHVGSHEAFHRCINPSRHETRHEETKRCKDRTRIKYVHRPSSGLGQVTLEHTGQRHEQDEYQRQRPFLGCHSASIRTIALLDCLVYSIADVGWDGRRLHHLRVVDIRRQMSARRVEGFNFAHVPRWDSRSCGEQGARAGRHSWNSRRGRPHRSSRRTRSAVVVSINATAVRQHEARCLVASWCRKERNIVAPQGILPGIWEPERGEVSFLDLKLNDGAQVHPRCDGKRKSKGLKVVRADGLALAVHRSQQGRVHGNLGNILRKAQDSPNVHCSVS